MKSSLSAVRSTIKTAITALGYAVYDRQRKVKDYPHVIIGEQTEVQDGDQGQFGQISTINIEVYNGWDSDYGERDTSDLIVTAITELITKPYSLVFTGFSSPVQEVDNIMSSTEQTQSKTIVVTVIRLRFHLFEEVITPAPAVVQFNYTLNSLIQ